MDHTIAGSSLPSYLVWPTSDRILDPVNVEDDAFKVHTTNSTSEASEEHVYTISDAETWKDLKSCRFRAALWQNYPVATYGGC